MHLGKGRTRAFGQANIKANIARTRLHAPPMRRDPHCAAYSFSASWAWRSQLHSLQDLKPENVLICIDDVEAVVQV